MEGNLGPTRSLRKNIPVRAVFVAGGGCRALVETQFFFRNNTNVILQIYLHCMLISYFHNSRELVIYYTLPMYSICNNYSMGTMLPTQFIWQQYKVLFANIRDSENIFVI